MARSVFSTVSAVVLAALVVLLGTTQPSASEPHESTFTGMTESGGVIQLTTTPDRAAITRLALEGVPLECASSPPLPISQVAYFSPPVPVTDGTFQLAVSSRTSIQSGSILTVMGAFSGNGDAEGSVRYAQSFGCELELSWELAGTIGTPPRAEGFSYTGSIGSTSLTVTTDAHRGGITSLTLAGLSVPGCTGQGGTQFDVPSMQLDFTAFFEPPQLNPRFQIGETRWQTVAEVEATLISDARIEGTLTIATSAYTTECSHDFDWEGALASPTATLTPPAQLPDTGLGRNSQPARISLAIAVLLMTGLVSIGLALARPTS